MLDKADKLRLIEDEQQRRDVQEYMLRLSKLTSQELEDEKAVV